MSSIRNFWIDCMGKNLYQELKVDYGRSDPRQSVLIFLHSPSLKLQLHTITVKFDRNYFNLFLNFQ